MFDQFWISLKKRNVWLIYMRYGAIVALISLVSVVQFIPNLQLDVLPIGSVALVMLLYNVLFHFYSGKIPNHHARFHGLHFALLQICADFVSLLAIIYMTGGIESPFSIFFIFHIIIGSLILPAPVVSIIISITIAIMLGGASLELDASIPHHPIHGLYQVPIYGNESFMLFFFFTFSTTLFISNFLANSISKELYLRERSLTNALQKLEEAEKAKSRYVMSVVHDLKTPIAAAITYLNMILDRTFGKISEELEHPLERSRLRLNNAITTINDILQLSQLKLSSQIKIDTINLTELLEEIYQEMRIMFVSKKLRFSTWTNATHDLHVQAETKLLKLALANLISNTYKYTDSGGKVEIHIKETNDAVILEIADNGIGIPKNEQDKIFDDFYRSSISKKKSTEGTGLGLSVVQHIVKQLNGSITFASPSRLAEGEDRPGTSFTITLPKVYLSHTAEE